jgi:hypothetical protein
LYFADGILESAVLVKVQLKEADLRGAHLEGAYLWDADLRETDLRNAHLTATYLLGAKLQGAKILDPESLEDANGGHDTELGEGIHRPDWRGFLPGTNAPEPLHPVDYSIKVCKTLLYVGGLGAGWYSSLFLPYCLSLTPAEVYFTGSSINFCSGPWVCDP